MYPVAQSVFVYKQKLGRFFKLTVTFDKASERFHKYAVVKLVMLFQVSEAAVVKLLKSVVVLYAEKQAVNPEALFRMFGSGDELCQYGTEAIRKSKMFLLFLGFQTLSSLFFSAIKKPHIAAMISLVRSALFIIPFLFIFPVFMGINGVFYAVAASDLCSTVIVAAFYIWGIKKLDDDNFCRLQT